jgi:hypothetical protein
MGKKLPMVSKLVCTKYVRTVRRQIMWLGTFLYSESNFFGTLHFPPLLMRFPVKGMGVCLILGK